MNVLLITLINIRSSLAGLSILLILVTTTTTTIHNSQSLFENNNSFMVYAQEIMGIPSGGLGMQPQPQQPQQPGEYSSGTIASIQNDQDGTPTWLLSGAWQGAIININEQQSKVDKSDSSTSTIDGNSDMSLPSALFEANFDMVMLNGSSLHQHSIYNFTLSDISKTNDKNSIVNGTATISMMDNPINDVPISIKTLNNNVISIWTDQSKINDHFGNTPIYGQIVQDVIIKK
jgi:hypothetical protein